MDELSGFQCDRAKRSEEVRTKINRFKEPVGLRIIVIGGVARSLINFRGPLLEAMVARGHEVIACAPDAPEDVREKLANMGVEYCHVPIKRAGMNPAGDLVTAFYLFRLFRRRWPDAVLGYTVKPVIWGCLAARAAGVPAAYAMITGLGYAFISGGGFRQQAVDTLSAGFALIYVHFAFLAFYIIQSSGLFDLKLKYGIVHGR